MVEIHSDEHGMVISFPYHDGDLDGVLPEGETVHLALRSVRGERRVLTLRGVKHFAVDEFSEENCVSDLRLSPLGRPCWATQALAERARGKWGVDLRQHPAEWLGFELPSSYGAHLVAICDDAEISEPGATFAVQS